MVKVIGSPEQPFAVGVTVIVAITVDAPVLVAVKEGISPGPPAASPIVGSLFVHVNVVPATGPVNGIIAVVAPLQYVALLTGSTDGVWFTIIL